MESLIRRRLREFRNSCICASRATIASVTTASNCCAISAGPGTATSATPRCRRSPATCSGADCTAQLDSAAFELPSISTDVDRGLRDIAGCDWLVGQRLHATVFASALGVPNLSLSYQPKCLNFLESICCEHLSVDTERLSGRQLVDRFEDLVAESGHWRARLLDRCGQYRHLQRQRAQALGWGLTALACGKACTLSAGGAC